MAPIQSNGNPIDTAAVNGATFVYVSVSAVLVICVGFFVVFACACCEKRKRKNADRSQISISEKIDLTIPPPEIPKEWEELSPETRREKPEPIIPKELKSPELKSMTLKPFDPKTAASPRYLYLKLDESAAEHKSVSSLMWKRKWEPYWNRLRTTKPLRKGKEAGIAESGKATSKVKKDRMKKKKRHHQRRSYEEERSSGGSSLSDDESSSAYPFDHLSRRELVQYLRDRNRYEDRDVDDLMRELNEWRRRRQRDRNRNLDKWRRMKSLEDYRQDYLRKTRWTIPEEPRKASAKEEPVKLIEFVGKREPSVRKIVPSAFVRKPVIRQGISEWQKEYQTIRPIEDFIPSARPVVKSCRDELGRKENCEKGKAPLESKYV